MGVLVTGSSGSVGRQLCPALEEVFFRGALDEAAADHGPVRVSTGSYVLATTATRNPALVLASVATGTLFALERLVSGGIQAPLLTHLTWSALMLRFLPPLFENSPPEQENQTWSTSNELSP